MCIGIFIIFFIGFGAALLNFSAPSDTMVVAMVLLIGAGLFLVSFLYYWVFHTYNRGQTLGKKWLKIRLVTDRAGPANGWTCMIRSVFELLDWVLFSGGVGILMILMTAQEKRIADFAAGTLVILDHD